jgi:acyl-CoA thioesterase
MKTPAEIVALMMEKDAFSQWLDVKILSVDKGKVNISCKITPEMVNGFSMAHGGISFSLGDSALAFSANSHGQFAVSMECNISHLGPVFVGDNLTANTQEIKRGKQTATYLCEIKNQDEKLVAHLKAVFFLKEIFW